jgi:tRNA pseudouridine38-40 synthase
LLPLSIAVRSAVKVDEDFHPRYDAKIRSYRYHIFCQPIRSPLRENFAWRVWPAVDLERMAQAAKLLVGRHDFSAFGTSPHAGGSTWRTVYTTSWQVVPDHWEVPNLAFEISADAFLFRMVRRLVYIQVAVGQGKLEPEVIRRSLELPPAVPLQGLAPPNGLYLMCVSYSEGKNLDSQLSSAGMPATEECNPVRNKFGD